RERPARRLGRARAPNAEACRAARTADVCRVARSRARTRSLLRKWINAGRCAELWATSDRNRTRRAALRNRRAPPLAKRARLRGVRLMLSTHRPIRAILHA